MSICIFTVSDFNYYNNFINFINSYIINETNKDKIKYIHFFIYKNIKEF